MKRLTLDYANRLIAQSIVKVNSDFCHPISITICDKHGDLIAFSRMDGAAPRSIIISQRKAYTAARTGVSTHALLERIQRENIEISYFGDSLFTAFPGGNLLKDKDNNIIGSIGISGLMANEDHDITEFLAELVRTESL
jgi:glc operon protein GlcG